MRIEVQKIFSFSFLAERAPYTNSTPGHKKSVGPLFITYEQHMSQPNSTVSSNRVVFNSSVIWNELNAIYTNVLCKWLCLIMPKNKFLKICFIVCDILPTLSFCVWLHKYLKHYQVSINKWSINKKCFVLFEYHK